MEELAKVRRVIAQRLPGAPHETLLVDRRDDRPERPAAGPAASRLRPYVTGIVLTKLDGTAKGGIAIAIAHELGMPIKLIGIGETLEDLRPFDPQEFARALLAPPVSYEAEPDRKASASVPGSAPTTYATAGQRALSRGGAEREDDAERPRDQGRSEQIGDPEGLSLATRNAAASATATATGVRSRSPRPV